MSTNNSSRSEFGSFGAGLVAALLGASVPDQEPKNPKNPAGSKRLRAAFKAVHGYRGTYDQALNWYRLLK